MVLAGEKAIAGQENRQETRLKKAGNKIRLGRRIGR